MLKHVLRSYSNIVHSIMGVITASIGSAAGIYVLVAITGYLTFGNDVEGNIVSMCKLCLPLFMRTGLIDFLVQTRLQPPRLLPKRL